MNVALNSVAATDLDSDGREDLVFGTSGTTVGTVLNLGSPSFSSRVSQPLQAVAVTSADLNGDGLPDLATTVGGSASVELNLGGGTFGPAVSYPTVGAAKAIAAKDLNHDGASDLVIGGAGGLTILFNAGDGAFPDRQDVNIGVDVKAVALADFNGDGVADLATLSDSLNVRLNDGIGNFGVQTNYSSGSTPSCMAAGDLNGDGKPDLVVGDDFGYVWVRLNLGNGSFGAAATYMAYDGVTCVTLADFNGDGNLDIGTAGYYAVSVLRNSGTGTFGGMRLDYSPTSGLFMPTTIISGDFNGDGRADVAVTSESAGQVNVLLGNGNGILVSGLNLTAVLSPHGISSDDFNGDGRADLVVGDSSAVSTSMWLNTTWWTAPEVAGVYVRGSTWTSGTLNQLGIMGKGDPVLGYEIPYGSRQLTTLPWGNVDQVSIRFNKDVTISQAALSLVGVNGGNLAVTAFEYDPLTHAATWTLAKALGTDAVQVSLAAGGADAVRDDSGNALDGEWSDGASAVSGDGVAGGDFTFGIRVLPGDTNGDNVVNFADFVALSNHYGMPNAGTRGGDLDGDGMTSFSDFVVVSNHYGSVATEFPPAIKSIVAPAPFVAAIVTPASSMVSVSSTAVATVADPHRATLVQNVPPVKPAGAAAVAAVRRAARIAAVWKAVRLQAQRRLAWFVFVANIRH
jgi:hypothetical protein